MNFIFIGDVHGNWKYCRDIAEKYKNSTIIQIGDLGIGFLDIHCFSQLPKNFYFFPGNHDKRKEAIKLTSCLGNYGESFGDKFFFVSGADSIDKNERIEDVSWWADEELTYKQGEDCLNKWENSKCNILVSHDCPQSFIEKEYRIYDKSITRTLLQTMIETRKPKMIISAHHHDNFYRFVDGIDWISLGIENVYFLNLL